MQKKIRVWLGIASLSALMLTGCAHPDFIDQGASEQHVLQELGPAAGKLVAPDGSFVLVYSDQPFGQQVWWMHFDKAGNFLRKEEAMNEEHWNLVKVGVHTKDDVYRMFGRCAQEYTFHLIDETAFMYRYEEPGGMDMAWWAQFNREGVVTETAVTQDPWDRDYDPLFHF